MAVKQVSVAIVGIVWTKKSMAGKVSSDNAAYLEDANSWR